MRTAAVMFLLLGFTPLAPAQPNRPPAKVVPWLPEGSKVEKNLAYGPHERNKLDIYLPPGDGPKPLLIWVHGGAWRAGSKDGGNPALRFLDKGYAVAAINYRLSQQALFPAQIEDCKAAVRWLRANAKKYNLDADHFGAWGASAGGHLVALLGTTGDAKDLDGDGGNRGTSSRVQAVCDWFGPTDFSKEAEQALPDSAIDRTKPDCPEALLVGGPLAEHPDRVKRANPITYIGKNCPPFLIVHGDKDNVVPVGQSRLLQDALKVAGVESTLLVIPGAGHGSGIGTPDQMRQIEAFFDRQLKVKK
ncbi:MAG TPA: alpha/beta hydrolase [Gemmataceae bacterium]|jgi:acetyl esterase/lipase|nr:alpha/beta hydrolase [Gemmataceae bacterium]